jgi:hypothetical protein
LGGAAREVQTRAERAFAHKEDRQMRITKTKLLLAVPIVVGFFGSAAVGHSQTERGMRAVATSDGSPAAGGTKARASSDELECGDPYEVCVDCVNSHMTCFEVIPYEYCRWEDQHTYVCTCEERFGRQWTESCDS